MDGGGRWECREKSRSVDGGGRGGNRCLHFLAWSHGPGGAGRGTSHLRPPRVFQGLGKKHGRRIPIGRVIPNLTVNYNEMCVTGSGGAAALSRAHGATPPPFRRKRAFVVGHLEEKQRAHATDVCG